MQPAPPPERSSAVTPAVSSTTAAAGSALSRKIKKVLAIRADSASCREAMSKVSNFFEENSVHSRRHLRADVEAESYKLHEKFVDDFSAVEKTLTNLDSLVADLENALTTATVQLNESKSKTQGVLAKASALRTQRANAAEKQQILKVFLDKFQIPDEQLQIVRSSDFPINNEFFDAVTKVEEIRQNARSMLDLMAHQGAPTAGVDILQETSDVLETAFERLFLWVQKQCRSPSQNSTWMRDKATFLRAMELLRERPVYFNHCITNVARARRQVLVQNFLNALSQGDPSHGVRPIEAHAYDPLRYCGDMLAWIHENAARERDQLAPCLDHQQENISRDDGLQLRGLESILDMVLEGLVHPFKIRVEGVLRVRNDQSSAIVSIYRTSQLFSHFAVSLTQILEAPSTKSRSMFRNSTSRSLAITSGDMPEPKSGFVTLLQELGQRTFQTFLDMCDTQAQKLRDKETATYSTAIGLIDLSTPSFVTETVKMLEEVLEIYHGSLTTETEVEKEENFHPILSAAYDPLLNHCRQIASSLDPLDRGVFSINCIASMRQPLTKYVFTASRLGMFVSLLDDEVTSLISSQSQNALRDLGISDLIEEMRNHETAPVNRTHLTQVLKGFYTSLFTLKTLALPQIDRIGAHNIRSEVRRGVSGIIADAYADLYELLKVDKELHAFATHTPDQVKLLLE